MYTHMELIYFFLVVDLLPLGLFLWLFRHLPPKEQLAALSPLLLQLAVLLVCGIFDGESLLFAFGFGLSYPICSSMPSPFQGHFRPPFAIAVSARAMQWS